MEANLNQNTPPPENRYRICMVSDDFIPATTGVGTHLKILTPLLASRGHHVTVITSRRKGQPEHEEWQGVKVYRCFSIPTFGFYQALPSTSKIREIFIRENIQIVHIHYVSILMMRAFRATKQLRLKNIYTYHMTADHLSQPLVLRPLRPMFHRLITSYSNRFSQIISPSKKLASRIANEGVTAPIEYISNPVVFMPGSSRASKVRKNDNSLMILYAGRLNPEKNLPLLLKATKELVARNLPVRLWIAGDGTMKAQLMKLANDLGIRSKVDFLGFLGHDALGQYYADCDVFVLPSIIETQGLVAMEAMRFGKPIIVTSAIISAEELVDGSVNGFIVAPHDPIELADKIELLGNNRDLARQMGEKSFEKSKNYEPEIIIEQMESLYSRL